MAGFKLGDAVIPHGLVLAPMAGVTDKAFRLIARRHGAEMTVSEMISAKATWYKDKKTAQLADFSDEERPISLQIFGREPSVMAYAAAELAERFPDAVAIDINMGCPVPKVAGNGDGCALMKEPELAGRIVRAVCDAQKKPVTVKMRTGWDGRTVNAPYLAQVCEQNGAALICVHGRTREQYYAPPVEHRTVAAVKRCVSVPVVANGGIYTARDAAEVLEMSGCDGVAIAQGAMGYPWIFREIAALLDGRTAQEPTPREVLSVALEHLDLLLRFKGEYIGAREARRQMAYYLKGAREAAAARNALNHAEDAEELRRIMTQTLLGAEGSTVRPE